MDKDRVKGIGKQVSGSIKQAFGKFAGNRKTQAEGAAEKGSGKAQETAGRAKDKVRDTLKD